MFCVHHRFWKKTAVVRGARSAAVLVAARSFRPTSWRSKPTMFDSGDGTVLVDVALPAV
jgi:hypothetical protein